jgi:hypothetical protein
MKGLTKYGTKPKKDWRGWQWNRVSERLPTIGVDQAIGLYLCGPEDIDRRIAMKKGFDPLNLIAVDLDAANVERVRSAGGLAIQAELSEVVLAWPLHTRLNFVCADFCGGLDGNAQRLLVAMSQMQGQSHTRSIGCVISCNLQRGRDVASGDFRATLIEHGQNEKHRGLLFFQAALATLSRVVAPDDEEAGLAGVREWGHRFVPALHSYRGARVMMDSVVFLWPWLARCPKVAPKLWDARSSTAGDLQAVRRKISACLAVRTRRLGAR